MRIPNSRSRHRWSASVLLVALLFRAYVPAGFMPAAGSPLLLALCPEGVAAPMPSRHDHHSGSPAHNHFEHCPFGSAPASGPVPTLLAFAPLAAVVASSEDVALLPSLPARWSPAHPPRGPPLNA